MSPIYTPGKLVLKKDSVAVDPNTDPNIASVSLLLSGNGINGSTSIIDSSPSPKTVTAFGNAQISTAQSKFGGTSIAFDGTGDYMQTTTAISINTSEDYTIECWVRLSGAQNSAVIVIGNGWNQANSFCVGTFTGNWVFSVGSTFNNVIASYATDSWDHIAVTRSGGNTNTFWLNGASQAVISTTTSFSGITGVSLVNVSPFTSATLNGYINDFRITKGVARYTANFTPPTAPFPNY